MSIEWSRRGHPLSSNIKLDKNLFQITELNDENEGQYECKYIKDLSIYSFVITLVTKGDLRAPTASIEPSTIFSFVGETISVTCLTTGNPRPYRRWYLNNRDIAEFSYSFTLSKSTLHINNATRDLTDSTITCEAWNNQGQTARASTKLVVKYYNDGQNSISTNIIVEQNTGIGGEVTFRCNHEVDIF